jgi:hypothetical protein
MILQITGNYLPTTLYCNSTDRHCNIYSHKNLQSESEREKQEKWPRSEVPPEYGGQYSIAGIITCYGMDSRGIKLWLRQDWYASHQTFFIVGTMSE